MACGATQARTHWIRQRSALDNHDPALAKARPGFDPDISAVIAFFSPTIVGHFFNPQDQLTPM
jgi:hypothetical protein